MAEEIDMADRYYVCIGSRNCEPCGWNSIDSDEEPAKRRTKTQMGGMGMVGTKLYCPVCIEDHNKCPVYSVPMEDYSLVGVSPDSVEEYVKENR